MRLFFNMLSENEYKWHQLVYFFDSGTSSNSLAWSVTTPLAETSLARDLGYVAAFWHSQ